MRRRPRLAILVVVFLALAAWLRYGPKPPADPALTEPPPFVAVEPTRVAKIGVTFDRDTTRIERVDGRWWIVSPVRFPADPVAIEALLNRTRHLVPRGIVPNDGGPGDPFGVKNPLVVLELGLTDGSTVRLDFGNASPAAQAFYVAVTGRDSLALIAESEADTYFRRPLDSWRDPSLFDFKPAEVLEVQLEGPGHRVTLGRTAVSEPWRVIEPFPGLGDDKVIGEYVTSLLSMRARHFPREWPAGAFDRDVRRIVVSGPAGRDTLEISGRPSSGPRPETPARVAGRPWPYAVPAQYLTVVDKSDLTFRDRRFLSAPPARLGRLVVSSGPDSIAFEPDSTGAWRLVGEPGTPGAPPPDRTSIVEEWARSDADSIVAAGDPLDPFAAPPAGARRLVLVAWDKGGHRLAGWEILARTGGGWGARGIQVDPPRPGEVLLVPSDLVLPLEAILAGR